MNINVMVKPHYSRKKGIKKEIGEYIGSYRIKEIPPA